MNALSFLTAAVAAQFTAGSDPRAPAGDTDHIRFGVVHLATGIRMHYAEQGDSTGKPLILLHGYSDSWFSFSTVLPHIPARYRVFALDLRGHGRTDKPNTGYGMDDLARDVIAFMDAKNLRGVTLVGHSNGGYVAQQVALAAPERLDRLVLVATTTTPRAIIGIGDLENAVRGLEDPVPSTFIREFQNSTIHRPLPSDFVDRVVSESSRLPAHVWKGVMDGLLAMDPVEGLTATRLSVMVLWGDADTLMPRSEQDALVKMFPDVVFKMYRETGHALHWERSAEFAADLIDFMER